MTLISSKTTQHLWGCRPSHQRKDTETPTESGDNLTKKLSANY